MGTSYTMDTSNSYVKYNISVTQNWQSVEGNYSNVTVWVWFWRTNTGYQTYGNGTCYCKINGTTYSASVNTSQKITNSGITLFSRTLDIGHNTDGTKTLDTSAWINIDAPLSSSEQWYSQALTTIPRASQPTLSSGTVTMGNNVTVYTNRASSSFTHVLYYRIGGGGWTTIATGIGTDYTWTVPTSLAAQTPNSSSLYLTMILETYNGGTYIGYKTVGLTTYVPGSYVPTISSVTLSETVSGIAAKFGGYVQGKSKIQGVITASGVASSTISSYSSSTNSQNFTTSTFTTNEIVGSGSQSVYTVVTDSRGRTANTTTNYTVIAYTNPTITTFTAVRANSGGIPDDQGAYVLCTINASISPVNNLNDKSFKIKYKKTTDGSYTDIDITPAGTTYTYNDTYLVSSIDTDYEYDFRLELVDYFSTVTNDKGVPTAFTLMDFNESGRGIAFGKVSTADNFEVAMDIEQENYYNGRRMQYIPSSIGATHGWYLVLSGEFTPDYDNHSFVLSVTEIYNGAHCFLYVNIRREVSSYWNSALRILTSGTKSSGTGLSKENFVLKIDGNHYYLYAQTLIDYQSLLFEVVSEARLADSPKTPMFTFNSPAYSDTVSAPTGTTTTAETYGPTMLYSNSSGTTGTVTLWDSAANYSWFEIYYHADSGINYSVKVYWPDGNGVGLIAAYGSSAPDMYIKCSNKSISGTSITTGSAYAQVRVLGGTPQAWYSNYNAITQVVGYK